MMTSVSFACVSKECSNTTIILIKKTGTSPIEIIEDFSPIKGHCGTAGHFWKQNKVKVGTGTTDCNSNRLRLELAMNKDLRTGKKAKEIWIGYYLYVPDTPERKNYNLT